MLNFLTVKPYQIEGLLSKAREAKDTEVIFLAEAALKFFTSANLSEAEFSADFENFQFNTDCLGQCIKLINQGVYS